MMRLIVAAACFTLLLSGMPTQSFAFDQGYGEYGYVMPNKFKRGQKAEKKDEPSLFGSSKKKSRQS